MIYETASMKSNYIEELKREFMEEFGELTEFEAYGTKKRLEDFMITKLLAREKELYAAMEEKEVSPSLCANCNFNGKLCRQCYRNRGINQAISDCQALLTRELSTNK